jgi:hypothetical protein
MRFNFLLLHNLMVIGCNHQSKEDEFLLNNHKINLRSLHVVRDELVVTIEQAATQLEGYVSDRENTTLLNACILSLQQIRGSLEVVELSGARELAGELLYTAKNINNDGMPLGDEKLSALTKGFFMLSCYLEYALQKEWGMPALMIPYINDIRISNRQPIMWESYFSGVAKSFTLSKNNGGGACLSDGDTTLTEGETIEALARRYRQMYQIGLLGVFRDLRVSASLELMKRALGKLTSYATDQPNHTFWWLSCHVIDVFLHQGMVFTLERKRLLSHLDKEFKRIEKEGRSGFHHVTDSQYAIEMAYYIALAGIATPPFTDIVEAYGFGDLGYTEEDRMRESVVLTGPSASTVYSVVDTLRGELRTAKDVIESSAESGSAIFDENDELIISMTRVRDILSVVGLKSAGETMNQQLEELAVWRASSDKLDTKKLMSMADTFLYVESVLDSIINSNLSDEKLSEINDQSPSGMLLNSHLASAQLVVLEEAEIGLRLMKRAFSSFSESLYDRVHIKNVAKTMNTVRGGMIVLELPRAAEIMACSIRFVQHCLLSNPLPAALEQMLETFADTIICLEYYLDCMKIDKNISADTLIIAEESLAVLGYGVNYYGK